MEKIRANRQIERSPPVTTRRRIGRYKTNQGYKGKKIVCPSAVFPLCDSQIEKFCDLLPEVPYLLFALSKIDVTHPQLKNQPIP